MHAAGLLEAMPAAFAGEVDDGRPVDPRSDEIADRVPRFTTPGDRVVLHLAASRLTCGPRMRPAGWPAIPTLSAALRREPITVAGDGEQRRRAIRVLGRPPSMGVEEGLSRPIERSPGQPDLIGLG